MKRIIGIWKAILIFTLILVLASCGSSVPVSKAAAEPTKESMDILNKAAVLVDSIKYADARKLLEDKYEIIKDNDLGLNAYGFLEFHIFKNYGKAEELYKEAIKLNPENPEHYKGIGYVYEAKGEFQYAIKNYEKAAKKTAVYKNLPFNSELAGLLVNISKCYIKLNDMEKAIEALEKASKNNPFSIEANSLLHKLYVEKEDYEKAYKVWKTDNLIDEGEDQVYKGILEWNRLYKDAAANKNNIEHLKMASLYAALVLYDEAAIEYEKALAQDKTNEDTKNKLYEVKTYLSFRDELQSLLDDYYRERCINGTVEELNFYKRIKPAYDKIAPLFPEIENTLGSTTTWIDTLNGEIEKKFNVRIKNITANGSMLGTHFGRIIDSSMIHSVLWGKEIDLKITTLKNMTSNGLDYWRSMGDGGVGGWSGSKTEIVRVIFDDENDDFLQLASLYNEDAKEDFVKKFMGNYIDKEEREPLQLYYSPEIQVRFITKQIDTEVDKARAKGISQNDLQRYLFDKFEKDFTIKTNIFVHESQHSIDNRNGFNLKWPGEGEYRPKLSQLAYGNMPFISLNQFYNSSIGEEINNTHIRANTQVFKDIVQYIYDNNGKFPQIDIKKNILTQLTKLGEDDIKGIAIDVFQKNYPDEKYQGDR